MSRQENYQWTCRYEVFEDNGQAQGTGLVEEEAPMETKRTQMVRTYRRPLDATELSFAWDGAFNGTADNVEHVELRLVRGKMSGSEDHRQHGDEEKEDTNLFSEANVIRAWLSTKRRYPLACATVQGFPSRRTDSLDATGEETTPQPHFIVHEPDLGIVRPGEIVFGEVTNAEEAQQRAHEILHGPRPLSEKLLVRLYVFRERTRPVLHLMTLMAHCVTDGVATQTFVRCLLDTLARGGTSDESPAQVPLEGRLAMAVPSSELQPIHLRALSPARKRWRRAVGVVIFQLRMAKRQGGHTLPCRLTRSTPYTAARSCQSRVLLTDAETAAVLANCRLYDVTFGNAYLPLAQVAMTRVLYRRYLRGEISENEWTYRQKQPHITGGPLNLRPYLDRSWLEQGGGGEFMLSIGFFFYQLPFMTLGSTRGRRSAEVLQDGAPPFSDLLSFNRFLHRAGLVKKQAKSFFDHPLFFEILDATSTARVERTRQAALQWMRKTEMGCDDKDEEGLEVMDMSPVWAHGGSSFGNVDLIYPTEYPLPRTHPLSPDATVSHPAKAGYVVPTPSTTCQAADPAPTIAVEYSAVRLHTRPAELYLSASSARGRLALGVIYDGNVYEDAVVGEWLDEVKAAVLWYFGQMHHPVGNLGRNLKPDVVGARL